MALRTFFPAVRHLRGSMPGMTEPSHKIIITGTGRTGTTFLVQLLTELGLDTGYTRQTWGRDYYEHCGAGLECDIMAENSPYIVKNPNFCETLPAFLATGQFVIDRVLVPVRDLDDAARSRIRIGGRDGTVPGGLLGTADPAAQKGILAEGFHRLMHSLAVHDIPHTLLLFPRLALDADYAWAKLQFLIPGGDLDRFRKVFKGISRPHMIHTFDASSAGRDGAAAAQFLLSERRKRTRRRAKRMVAWAILGVALVLSCVYACHRSAEARAAALQGPTASVTR
jgi:hypothetical protein